MSQRVVELPQEPEELPGREERRKITRERTIQMPGMLIGSNDGEEKHEQARVAKELDMAGVIDAGLGNEEFGLICKCEGNTIDPYF